MNITVELSLYPLHDDPIPVIEDFIRDLADADDIEVVTNQMSTQLRGELGAIMRTVEQALRRSFSCSRHRVLIVKFLNADLPIAELPRL